MLRKYGELYMALKLITVALAFESQISVISGLKKFIFSKIPQVPIN